MASDPAADLALVRSLDAYVDLLASTPGESMREGLTETPARAARAWQEMTSGYNADVASILKTFPADGFDQIVALRDIPMQSLCEHHLLPFVGRAHIAYIPNGRVYGLSKLPRLVNAYARRLQVQERLTHQVATALATYTPDVLVIVEAEHLCMTIRGVQAPGTITSTSCALGAFRTNGDARAEAMRLLLLR